MARPRTNEYIDVYLSKKKFNLLGKGNVVHINPTGLNKRIALSLNGGKEKAQIRALKAKIRKLEEKVKKGE